MMCVLFLQKAVPKPTEFSKTGHENRISFATRDFCSWYYKNERSRDVSSLVAHMFHIVSPIKPGGQTTSFLPCTDTCLLTEMEKLWPPDPPKRICAPRTDPENVVWAPLSRQIPSTAHSRPIKHLHTRDPTTEFGQHPHEIKSQSAHEELKHTYYMVCPSSSCAHFPCDSSMIVALISVTVVSNLFIAVNTEIPCTTMRFFTLW